jgi:hypothetical protein
MKIVRTLDERLSRIYENEIESKARMKVGNHSSDDEQAKEKSWKKIPSNLF